MQFILAHINSKFNTKGDKNMATKKNYNHKKRSMKKYSIVEKLEYHSKRQGVPGRFGLDFGDPKHQSVRRELLAGLG